MLTTCPPSPSSLCWNSAIPVTGPGWPQVPPPPSSIHSKLRSEDGPPCTPGPALLRGSRPAAPPHLPVYATWLLAELQGVRSPHSSLLLWTRQAPRQRSPAWLGGEATDDGRVPDAAGRRDFKLSKPPSSSGEDCGLTETQQPPHHPQQAGPGAQAPRGFRHSRVPPDALPSQPCRRPTPSTPCPALPEAETQVCPPTPL